MMLKLSDALLEKYRMLLDKQGIAPRDHNNYKKWLRYYLDFCKKYHYPVGRKVPVPYPAEIS
jgi:hypothetical protein